MGKQARQRTLPDDEACAISRKIRTTPGKLNTVAASIRGKTVSDALAQLSFCQRRVSKEVTKALRSALFNAENNHQLDVDSLYVREAWVGKALIMKRFRARARGRGGRVEKSFSNLTIIVREARETA